MTATANEPAAAADSIFFNGQIITMTEPDGDVETLDDVVEKLSRWRK